MMGNKMSLTEATMLALQGKLVETKLARKPLARAKKEEAVDISVDDKTSVNVDETTTIVETEDATIIVEEHKDEVVAPVEEPIITDMPIEEPAVVEVPVEGEETIIPEEIIEEPVEEIVEPVEDEISEELEESKEIISESANEDESKKLQEEISDETCNIAEKIAEEIRKVGCMSFMDIDTMAIEMLGITMDEYKDSGKDTDLYTCLNVNGIGQNFSSGDFYTDEYAKENPDVLEESKLEEVSSEGVYSLHEIIVSELKNIKRLGGYIPGENNGAIAGEYLKTLDDNKLNELAQNLAEDDTNNDIWTAYHEFMFLLEDRVAKLAGLTKTSKEESKKLYEVKDITARMEKQFLDDMNYIKELGGFDDKFETSKKATAVLNNLSAEEIANLAKEFSNNPEHYDIIQLYDAYIFGLESKIADMDKKEESKSLKFNSKSFNEALTKYFKNNYKTVESIKINKLGISENGIMVEAKLISSDKKEKDICLEMNKVSTAKSFAKYTLKEAKGLLRENKQNANKLTMMTFTNKDNVLECKYLICK